MVSIFPQSFSSSRPLSKPLRTVPSAPTTIGITVTGIIWSICILKSQKIFSVSFSCTDSVLHLYHFVLWSKFNIAHNFQLITFSKQLNLVLHSFSASLLHLFTMSLIVSTLSLYNQLCCVLLLSLLFLWEFFIPAVANGFPSEFEWQQVSRTLLSVLVDLNNAVAWMLSTCPLISKSSTSFYQSFGDCSKCIMYNWYQHYFHVP